MDADLAACIEACNRAHGVALGMAMNHCLEAGGDHVAPQHFRLMADCAAMCATAADFMLRSLGVPRRELPAVRRDLQGLCRQLRRARRYGGHALRRAVIAPPHAGRWPPEPARSAAPTRPCGRVQHAGSHRAARCPARQPGRQLCHRRGLRRDGRNGRHVIGGSAQPPSAGAAGENETVVGERQNNVGDDDQLAGPAIHVAPRQHRKPCRQGQC